MSPLLARSLVLAALGRLTLAQIDISAVAQAGPPPTPVIATNVPSQVIKYNHVAVEKTAAAEQSAEATSDGVQKRAACDPQWLGSGPVPTPDTVEAFQQNQAMRDAANNAPTPPGYKLAYKNLNSTANALGYVDGDANFRIENADDCEDTWASRSSIITTFWLAPTSVMLSTVVQPSTSTSSVARLRILRRRAVLVNSLLPRISSNVRSSSFLLKVIAE